MSIAAFQFYYSFILFVSLEEVNQVSTIPPSEQDSVGFEDLGDFCPASHWQDQQKMCHMLCLTTISPSGTSVGLELHLSQG